MISAEDSRNASYVVFATFATQTVVTMSNSTLPTIAPKLVFGGVLIGPSVFALLYSVIESHSTTFVIVAIASAAGGALLLLARRAAPRHA